MFSFILVFSCLVLTVFATMDQYEERASSILFGLVGSFQVKEDVTCFQGNRHHDSIHARILPPPVVGRLSLPVPGIGRSHQIRTAPVLHHWSHRGDRINCALLWWLCWIARHVRHLGPALIAFPSNRQNGPCWSTRWNLEIAWFGGIRALERAANCLLHCLFGAYLRFILDLSGTNNIKLSQLFNINKGGTRGQSNPLPNVCRFPVVGISHSDDNWLWW